MLFKKESIQVNHQQIVNYVRAVRSLKRGKLKVPVMREKNSEDSFMALR